MIAVRDVLYVLQGIILSAGMKTKAVHNLDAMQDQEGKSNGYS